jgi:hypothetical protein
MKYGIMLSGGLDSAVLMGTLLIENPAINLQPFTIPKADGAALYANPIIDFLNKKFGTRVPHTILVGNPLAHHRAQSRTAFKEIFEKHDVDVVYNALNKNPPPLTNLPTAPVRDEESPDSRVILPFAKLLKSDILRIMIDNDLEDLIELTHTCTEQKVGRCGKCWQCSERMWAFDTINLSLHDEIYVDSGYL